MLSSHLIHGRGHGSSAALGSTALAISPLVLTLLLFLVPAFVLHTSPRFAGSLAGFALGVAAATLMVALLIYPLAKYSVRLKPWITRVASMPNCSRSAVAAL